MNLGRLQRYGPPLLVLAAVLALFSPALGQPSLILFPTFSDFSDVMVIHWPKARLMAQSWQAGAGLPYWTPLILSGMPLAANQLAMLFYPPAWLFLMFPAEPVFNLLFVFHLVLGGLGAYYLLGKAFNVSAFGGLLAGLTFALNGKLVAHSAGGHVSMVGAIGWLPWVILGLMMVFKVDDVPAEGGPRTKALRTFSWALLAGVALAMQLLTHSLIFLYSAYLSAAIIGWHLLLTMRRSEKVAQDLLRCLPLYLPPLLIIPLIAFGLGAVQVWPVLELAQYSNRSLNVTEAAEYAVSPLQLGVGLLLPNPQAGHEQIIYLGLVPLLLAPFGLRHKSPWRWFFGLIFVFAVLFALGSSTPVHGLFYQGVLGFRWVRTPARMIFVGTLALSVLVGLGFDDIRHNLWSSRSRRWVSRLAVGLGALAMFIGLGLALGFGQINRATLGLAVILPGGLGLVWLAIYRIGSPTLIFALLGLLLFVDMASFDHSLMRFVSVEEATAAGRAAAAYLADKPGRFRVYSPSYSLPMQTAALTGVSLADGVEPVHLSAYDQFMARAGGYHDSGFSVTIPNFADQPLDSALAQVEPDVRLLGLLNVEYLAAAFPMPWPGLNLEHEIDGTFIYRNERALPPAWLVYDAVPASSDWLSQLSSLPLDRMIAVEDNFTGALKPGSAQAGGQVRLIAAEANRITLAVEAIPETGAWLVLSELWYPGWQARVAGESQPVLRVNGLLRGIRLDTPGSYEIELSYRPRSVIWGSRISMTTLGLILLATGWIWFRKSN